MNTLKYADTSIWKMQKNQQTRKSVEKQLNEQNGWSYKALPVCCIWKPQQGKDFAVSDGMIIFVSEKPAKGDKIAVLLLNCYPLS